MTTPITHLQALEYHRVVAEILDRADPEQIARLRDALELPPDTLELPPATTTPDPDFCYSQVQAAEMVCAALGLKPATFRANKPWLLLQQKLLGEGAGFCTPISKKTGKPSPRLRRYTQKAVDFLIKNWDLTRFAF
ncbi:hypothetical protein [Acidithiobacillus ferrooxidans]|uniref:Uncharacterized protein n=1 Tax=Acidithiobacillus ferrooxidans TaxID=920 RepID=A0A2W1KJ39_ACIFR|nr:hypothetical protein [Acidithiobacillus ferrooxidans]MBU2817343.1 hypothetical protein [Acidithiobacillus ferrooxidans]MCR1341320.1 hypothetical protein [Acidithiobacillus ferrooxidans]PZD81774.1 hypothetical protein DN052_01470 [Acidithiobacillus ferrooxidans]QLK41928.1 hypothetical protein FE661_06995 [Acidithiobacillus ferrooxidans]QZT53894.1 hypothetical protein K7B00_06990 [Acidithiobacillus ferrooxidans]